MQIGCVDNNTLTIILKIYYVMQINVTFSLVQTKKLKQTKSYQIITVTNSDKEKLLGVTLVYFILYFYEITIENYLQFKTHIQNSFSKVT